MKASKSKSVKPKTRWCRIVPLMAVTTMLGTLCASAHMEPVDDGGNGHRHHRRRDNGFIPDVPNPDPGPQPRPRNRPRPDSNDDRSDRPDLPDPRTSDRHPDNLGTQRGAGRVYGGYGRGDGWRRDWDDRWRKNWGNSWSSYDNDSPPVVHRLTTVNNVEVNNVSNNNGSNEQWSSISKPGMEIPNFHEVHHYLFRGGQPTPEGLEQLYHMGIRTIVDLRTDPAQIQSERQLCSQQNLKFVSIPVDKTTQPSAQMVQKFMAVVDAASKHPDSGAVYVHCHHGSDRTGFMVAMYRVMHDNYSYADAYDEMTGYGFNTNFTKLSNAVKAEAASIHSR